MLKDEERNFGPKPFKIFDAWLMKMVLIKLSMMPRPLLPVNNLKGCMFRNRLKNVKIALKERSNKNFINLDDEIEAIKGATLSLELKTETSSLNENERLMWRESRKKWLEKERLKSNMLKKKARIKWVIEGEENTNCFHSITHRKNNKSNITGLTINGVWNDSLKEIKEEIFTHFKSVFEEPNIERPSMEELSYPYESVDNASALEDPTMKKKSEMMFLFVRVLKHPGQMGSIYIFSRSSEKP
ncbi:uncharacterized protein [Rutidosis leptorrhynchoides]|uniref:uncharacterized protein n=1 Tax=Rutidosis leptorrhynchoides TaxID=125765 RepID=UPI003A9984CD